VLSVDEAQHRILQAVGVLGRETLAISGALHYSVARNVIAPYDVPPFDNSAMDGFALRAENTSGAAPALPIPLKIVGRIMAGDVPPVRIGPGECAAVMTGAAIPEGADAVVMIEDVTVESERILLESPVAREENIRRAGEDIAKSTTLLEAGAELRPQEIGVLASLGIAQIEVVKKPVVAIIATGDELVSTEEPLGPGKIRDSNRHSLRGLVLDSCCLPLDVGIVRDNEGEILNAFKFALDNSDAILSTGGVSMGEHDLVRDVLSDLARFEFWKVRMKPGKPLAFAVADGKPLFGLPGNPVSCMVSFEIFARPALLKMMGRKSLFRQELSARTVSPVSKQRGRSEFSRGRFWREGDVLLVDVTGPQGSGILSSLVRANCLIHLPEERDHVAPGEAVSVIPL
jgi:molybdopterin molybdotransferase